MFNKYLFILIILSSLYSSTFAAGNYPERICTGENDGYFFTDFRNCQNYFVCVNGIPRSGSCAEGLLFHEKYQLCDYFHNVKCIQCNEDGVYNTALANSCSEYIICFNGEGAIASCPQGLSFSATYNSCIPDTLNDCIDGLCPTIFQDHITLNLPSRERCDQFLRCTSTGNTTLTCPLGTYFDKNIERCNLIENVPCQVLIFLFLNSSKFNETIVFQQFDESPATCPETGIHLIANPEDCGSYFICFGGTRSTEPINCAPNLIFDIHTSQCRGKTPSTICIKDHRSLN